MPICTLVVKSEKVGRWLQEGFEPSAPDHQHRLGVHAIADVIHSLPGAPGI